MEGFLPALPLGYIYNKITPECLWNKIRTTFDLYTGYTTRVVFHAEVWGFHFKLTAETDNQSHIQSHTLPEFGQVGLCECRVVNHKPLELFKTLLAKLR